MGDQFSKELGLEDYIEFDLADLPRELFWHILSFVPAVDIVKNCSLVCKLWNTVCRDSAFWTIKCQQEGKYSIHVMGHLPVDLAKIYIKNPLMRNLLKNTKALEGLACWTPVDSCRPPAIETSPTGADPIKDNITSEAGPVYNWVTSYTESYVTQQVNFIIEGCSAELMDDVKPPIDISVWYAARFDCGIRFRLHVELRGDNNELITTFQQDIVVDTDRMLWHKLEHTFMDYLPGVRVLVFTMGGVDTQFWAGNYGPKFTLPCVRFNWDKFERKN